MIHFCLLTITFAVSIITLGCSHAINPRDLESGIKKQLPCEDAYKSALNSKDEALVADATKSCNLDISSFCAKKMQANILALCHMQASYVFNKSAHNGSADCEEEYQNALKSASADAVESTAEDCRIGALTGCSTAHPESLEKKRCLMTATRTAFLELQKGNGTPKAD